MKTDELTGKCADSTAVPVETPADLVAAGYRIELGAPDDRATWLRGKYWWTWTKPPAGGFDCALDEWDTAEGAIEDARLDMKAWEGVPLAQQRGPR